MLVGLGALVGFAILNFGSDLNSNSSLTSANSVEAATSFEPSTEVIEVPEVAVVVPTVAPARPNSEVSVLVANGSGVNGRGGELTNQLRNVGFSLRPPQNANSEVTSTIYFREGFEAEARNISEQLNAATPYVILPEELIVGPEVDLVPIDVLVLIGEDTLAFGS